MAPEKAITELDTRRSAPVTPGRADMTTGKRAGAVAFFRKHAGYSYGQGETPAQGRTRCARELAADEAWLAEQAGHTVEWVEDTHYNRKDYDIPMPPIAWGCVVKVGEHTASLWAVTFDGDHFPAGKPYARVVVAELAGELRAEIEG